MNVESAKKRFYPPEQKDVFMSLIDDVVKDGSRVLDVGAGAGEIFRYDLKERVQDMVGVDTDHRVKSNPLLHRHFECSITSIPVEDNYFDVAFSRYVLEHITEPRKFLQEMHRVLKPGGRIVFLTPNKWHYVSIGARLTPHWFHGWYNVKLRGLREEDVFPTVYLMNSARTLRRQFASAGFEEERLIQREVCPYYLCWSLPSFYIGLLYERLVNSTRFLAGFRVHLLGVYTKKSSMEPPTDAGCDLSTHSDELDERE